MNSPCFTSVINRAGGGLREDARDLQGGGADLQWRRGAWKTLAAVRATYEPVMHGLAGHLLIPLPSWVAADDATDHWERGARGIIASRLISSLADRSISDSSAKSDPRGGGWVSRVRKRLGSS